MIVEPGQRRFFRLALATSELVSLIGNGAHAAKVPITAPLAALIAGAAPVAAMAVMHGLTILIEAPTEFSDFDALNADRIGNLGPRNAFGRDAEPGDVLTGVFVGAERRHRYADGKPLFQVDKLPSPTETGPAVMDSYLIVRADARDDEDDDGQRFLRL